MLGGYVGLAAFHERSGRPDLALNVLKTATQRAPSNELAGLYDIIAQIYGKLGNAEESMVYFDKELELAPNSSSALAGKGNNYFSRKEFNKALTFYRAAIEKNPDNYDACYNIALTYDKLGNTARAYFYYKMFLSIAPKHKYQAVFEQIEQRLNSTGR